MSAFRNAMTHSPPVLLEKCFMRCYKKLHTTLEITGGGGIREEGKSSMMAHYNQLSTSKKVIVIVFVVWLVQAVPKWSAAIFAGNEVSASIMRVFIDPRL